LDGFGAIGRCARAQVDQITRIAEDRGKAMTGLLLLEPRDLGRLRRPAKPLHVILDEDLDDFAAHRSSAFQRLPDPAANGHVGAEFHGPSVARLVYSFFGVCKSAAILASKRPAAPPSNTR
jgi:hypothetical protein